MIFSLLLTIVMLLLIFIRTVLPIADNFLKLYNDKTELLFKGNPERVANIHNFQLIVGDNDVTSSTCA